MTEAPGGTGAELRLARLARGFSQQQLASMAGVTRQAVSALESGHSDPSLRVALALAHALGLSVEELFGPREPAAPVTVVRRPARRPGRARLDRSGRGPLRRAAAANVPSLEVQALLKVLSSAWLLAQLASLPGYDAANCGDRLA